MPEVQRSDSVRSAPVENGRSYSAPSDRSVSFNRDVHVKRIGRGAPRISAALAGDGEGRLITTPVHKESITSRSKKDLAQEAALVLQQAGSVRCVAHDNRYSPDRFNSLPLRSKKKRPEVSIHVRHNGEEISQTDELPTPKKKALQRSVSDAGAKKLKNSISKLFSPKLERKSKPLGRSVSDAGSSSQNRKRSGSESESSYVISSRAKKQLSPIIESSSIYFDNKSPFVFESKKAKNCEEKAPEVSKVEIKVEEPPKKEVIIPITVDKENVSPQISTCESTAKEGTDEVDRADDNSMLHSSWYGQGEESTIHKMIHRLSNDRSPPPQLTRTMVSPSPGFGHNNNRPFSYTRPNDSSPSPTQNGVIYAQVQMDKKKAHRSHSDSDEGLGLDRKDSSRENSPAEKEYRRTDYYNSDIRRNNEINSFETQNEEFTKTTTRFGDYKSKDFPYRNGTDGTKNLHKFDEIDRNLFNKPDKYTSTVFVDSSDRGRADGMADLRRREEFSNQTNGGITSKTSELSARRDLLESRIKSRLLADELFAARNNVNVPKKMEHEIVDKPIVPSPVTPNRIASPKRYTDTYITETRTNSNGEKYIFEKKIHDENGKVYGYEKKINKIPSERYSESPKLRDGYTFENKKDKYGDKYVVETRTEESYTDEFKPFLSDRSRTSPEERLSAMRNVKPSYTPRREHGIRSSPTVVKKFGEYKFSKSEDVLNGPVRPVREQYIPKSKKTFEAIRGKSKSTQRLDEIGENARIKALRSEYTTRSHENLSSGGYLKDSRNSASPAFNGYKERAGFIKRHLDDLHEIPNDDYDTDISQITNSQLESKYIKETRTTQRYLSSKHALQDDYDSSPPRIRIDRNGYNSSRYDSDTTARDSIRTDTRYSNNLRKEYKGAKDDPKKPLRRSHNRLDYLDDSDARESPRGKISKARLEGFDEPPTRPPRVYHESKTRHMRIESSKGVDRRHRDTRLSDLDRKDRLADSGIENDYRRDSQEADRREPLESEDESIVTMQFLKQERKHADKNMNGAASDKYEKSPLTSKPPSGLDKKYEKKVTKMSGTMSKVKQLFSKKEKKKEEKNKKGFRGSSGALTDDEVMMRYREYRGDQLRSTKSARDLGSDFYQEEFNHRRRLSTPSGSPSPCRPSRLSRSTGTLTQEEESYCESNTTLTKENQGQEAERKGWFKSLSRKNKSTTKPIDKKSRIPESEILTTGTEDEEASSAPERVSVQKSLRFFGDTDQESISSNRDRRNKRPDDHVNGRRDVTKSNRHGLGILPSRKPRLTESALSSGESTTGDSSQQSQNSQRSQRSVVYLHAATVGEIPGPNERRRAASREELNRPLQPHTRTVSRSVSVLAPWRPRHYREPYEINYDQTQHQKPLTTIRRRQRSRETLNRRNKEARRSKDNLSKTGTITRSTLKSKDKQKPDRTVSTESLSSKSRGINSRSDLSRSTSVPRDPNKSAGWFKLRSKKSRS